MLTNSFSFYLLFERFLCDTMDPIPYSLTMSSCLFICIIIFLSGPGPLLIVFSLLPDDPSSCPSALLLSIKLLNHSTIDSTCHDLLIKIIRKRKKKELIRSKLRGKRINTIKKGNGSTLKVEKMRMCFIWCFPTKAITQRRSP